MLLFYLARMVTLALWYNSSSHPSLPMGLRPSTPSSSSFAYYELKEHVRCAQCGFKGPDSLHQPYMVLLYGVGKYDGRALCLDCMRDKLRS